MVKRKKEKFPTPGTFNSDIGVVTNLGLVHRLAQRYKWFCNNTSITYADLVQEGAMGLMVARRKYDPTRGVRFSTYANYWIRAKILRLLDRHTSTIHVTYPASAEYNKLVKKYGSSNGVRGDGFQSMEELIDKVTADYNKGKIKESDYKKYVDILQARSPMNFVHVSLDDMSQNDPEAADKRSYTSEDGGLGVDVLKHLKHVDSIEDILSRDSIIQRLLEGLTPEETRLVKLYHGLEDDRARTYKELAVIFKCSKQKVHQTHQKIMRKLKNKMKGICLIDKIQATEFLGES